MNYIAKYETPAIAWAAVCEMKRAGDGTKYIGIHRGDQVYVYRQEIGVKPVNGRQVFAV